jgi:hypothetical protein
MIKVINTGQLGQGICYLNLGKIRQRIPVRPHHDGSLRSLQTGRYVKLKKSDAVQFEWQCPARKQLSAQKSIVAPQIMASFNRTKIILSTLRCGIGN